MWGTGLKIEGGAVSQALHDCFPFGGFGEAFFAFLPFLPCSAPVPVCYSVRSYQNRLAWATSKIEHGWSYWDDKRCDNKPLLIWWSEQSAKTPKTCSGMPGSKAYKQVAKWESRLLLVTRTLPCCEPSLSFSYCVPGGGALRLACRLQIEARRFVPCSSAESSFRSVPFNPLLCIAIFVSPLAPLYFCPPRP